MTTESLEADLHLLAGREQEAKGERERLSKDREEENVSSRVIAPATAALIQVALLY
jgi:hypothetical protein